MLPRFVLRSLIVASLFVGLQPAAPRAQAAPGVTFTVNTLLETDDVNPGNGTCLDAGGKCSLRAALMEANARPGADTITIPSGTYSQTKRLNVTDDLTVNGAGRTGTLIAGAGSSGAYGFSLIDITTTLELNDLTLTNFQKAIYLLRAGNSQVEVYNSNLRGNVNTNTSESGSALTNYCDNCAVGLHTTYIYGNKSPACGAIHTEGTLVIDMNSQVYGNEATTTIGGAMCSRDTAITTIAQSLVLDNHASGPTSAFGGAIISYGTLVIVSSEISSNSAETGGGLYISAGTLNMLAGSINGNRASVGGGILIGPGATVLMNSSTVQNNDATNSGGGIFNWDRLEIKNSAIVSNTALKGGGLYVADSTATLTNTTISGNTATEDGAGIYSTNDALVRLANVTISNNTADSDDNGDGMGGGVYQASSSVIKLKNSILAGNEDLTLSIFELYAPDCHGTLTSDGYNLIGLANALCAIDGNSTGNLVKAVMPGLDPRLGALMFNGLTWYHPLRFGPAVDRGNPAGCADFGGAILTVDQSSNTRPYGSASGGYTPRCDMGASEAASRRFDIFGPHVKR